MYDMTGKLYGELAGRGLEAGTEAFEQAFAEEMATQAKRVGSRLFLELPHRRHVCFYPMNKRRGEIKNWYSAPFDDRAAMMREHGHIGRQVRRQGHADHLGLDRVRRLGMGRRPVRRRSGRLQAADLRDALRSRERRLRRVRRLRGRPAVLPGRAEHAARRPDAGAAAGLIAACRPASPPPPATDPTPVYRHRDGLYAADLVTAGLVWLDVFSHLDRQPSTLDALCAALGLHARPADVMVTLFAAMGLVVRDGGVIRLTPLAREHFVARLAVLAARPTTRPSRPGPCAATSSRCCGPASRPGSPAPSPPTGSPRCSIRPSPTASPRPWTAAGCTSARPRPRALDLAGRRALLDIAGGSGIYACAFVDRHPHLTATVFERPPVDDVARRAIAGRGFDDRVGVAAGDMLRDPLPPGTTST